MRLTERAITLVLGGIALPCITMSFCGRVVLVALTGSEPSLSDWAKFGGLALVMVLLLFWPIMSRRWRRLPPLEITMSQTDIRLAICLIVAAFVAAMWNDVLICVMIVIVSSILRAWYRERQR